MHWAVRNDQFLFLNASSWLPYSTVGWLVFNVNKLHFLQSNSLEQYSIFARKIIKNYQSHHLSFLFLSSFTYSSKNQNKPSLRQSDHNNKRSEFMIKLFLQGLTVLMLFPI